MMLALLTTAWLTPAAHAQVEVCTEPYSRIQLGAAVGKVGDAFDDQDLYAARERLNEIGERIVCLDEVVDRKLFAKFARLMSINYFFEQDEEGAIRWGRASALADPGLMWDEGDFPADHPLRELLGSGSEPRLVVDEEHGLDVPKKGGVFMSGELITEPRGHAETPSLVQVFDGDQQLVGGYWQDGIAFRDWVIHDDPKPVDPPKWWTGDGPSSFSGVVASPAPSKPDRSRSRGGGGASVSVVPLVASGTLVAISGVTYALASITAGTLDEQTTSEDLTRVRSTANALVVASGASLAAGVGIGVGGVLASGGPGVRFHVRF